MPLKNAYLYAAIFVQRVSPSPLSLRVRSSPPKTRMKPCLEPSPLHAWNSRWLQYRPRRRASRLAAQNTSSKLDLVSFSFILDDLVYPDGTTLMAQPGGGGPQTLWGFQLHRGQEARVGVAAQVGADMPPGCRDWLAVCGIDQGGLLTSNHLATPRAWQVLENDGRRAEIWRTVPTDALARMLRPALTSLPPPYRQPLAHHLAVNPSHPDLQHLEHIRQHNPTGLLSLETFTTASSPLTPAQLGALLSLCTVFSPNEAEAISMLDSLGSSGCAAAGQPSGAGGGGWAAADPPMALDSGRVLDDLLPGSEPATRSGRMEEPPWEASPGIGLTEERSPVGHEGVLEARACVRMTRAFLEAGAGVVALRRGAQGAVVHSVSQGAWNVPAVEGTLLVDPTGCGNAFCGAFLAALAAGEEIQVAGAWGCVAGSLMAEHRGVPQLPPAAVHGEAKGRVEALLLKVQRLGD